MLLIAILTTACARRLTPRAVGIATLRTYDGRRRDGRADESGVQAGRGDRARDGGAGGDHEGDDAGEGGEGSARGAEADEAEASETQKRCTQLAGTFRGKKSAILEEARDVKQKGATMLKTYLDGDADALDGFEFLTMAEAGEVATGRCSSR